MGMPRTLALDLQSHLFAVRGVAPKLWRLACAIKAQQCTEEAHHFVSVFFLFNQVIGGQTEAQDHKNILDCCMAARIDQDDPHGKQVFWGHR